jgi:thiopeptide-type bacteriocin biosynthesis protein
MTGTATPPSTALDPEWVSAHLFYHGDLDRVVVDAVEPVITALGAGSTPPQWFFLRYWDGGPHVRLRLRSADTPAGRLRALVVERAGSYFRAHPAPTSMPPADYVREARQLAAAEGMADYLRAPVANNSVVFIPYRREHDRYGAGASVEAVERHFTDSSRIALDLLRAGLSPGRRATAALSLILLTWYLCDLGAHAGDLDHTTGVAGPLDPGDQSTAIAIAHHMRALATRPLPVDARGTFPAWRRSVTTLRDTLAALVAAGEFSPPTSGYHSTLVRGATARARVFPVLDICAHLACNRLGVSPPEELRLRRLALRAVTEKGR